MNGAPLDLGFAVHFYDPADGTGRYAVELVQRLAGRHRVTLYTAEVRAPVPGPVEVVEVPALRRFAYGTMLTFPLGLGRRRRRHDLLHVQGWMCPTADVVTAHIVLRAWRRAMVASGQRRGRGERLLAGLMERLEALQVQRAACVLVPSQRARADLAREYGRAHEVHVIPHGFPAPATSLVSPAAARKTLGLPSTGFLALYVGDGRKGLEAAQRAVAATPGCHLAVVTRTPPERAPPAPTALRLEGRLHWIGPLADVSDAYRAADVLLHPTVYDTFGMVVAEAMAAGLPVITTRAAGAAELIEPGRTGWVAASDPDGRETTRLLAHLRGDAPLRSRTGRAAREAAAGWTWDDVARETELVYRRVVMRRLTTGGTRAAPGPAPPGAPSAPGRGAPGRATSRSPGAGGAAAPGSPPGA